MLEIGLDVRALDKGFKAHCGRGTGRYVTELVPRLEKLCEQSTTVKLHLLSGNTLRPSQRIQSMIGTLPFGRYTIETQMILPRQLRGLGLDLFHFFAHGDAPAFSHIPYVVTVLDLIPLRFPELYQPKKRNWRFEFARALERRAIQNARGIIAISEATKRDLVELMKVNNRQICVIPLGLGDNFRCAELELDLWYVEKCAARAHFDIPIARNVLLYVGGIDPRKNVEFLLRCFAELLKGTESPPLLLLAGPYENDDQYPKLQAELRRLGIGDNVRFLGFVKDSLLPRLYTAADLFVFPSLYEGFGLPVLEALGRGTPVVAGKNSSLPEVGSDAVTLLPDGAMDRWVHTIQALLASPERRYELSRIGIERAHDFTWERTADKTIAAYQQFMKILPTHEEVRDGVQNFVHERKVIGE